MLNTIKSKYIMKNIFLLLDEKKLLQLVAYNKELQNLMDIKLICYKVVSGKYFLWDKNGYGKEYNINDDELIFEGEYLNGKRNGKGKEYEDDELVFEWEYLNGKRWNGKEKKFMHWDYKHIFQEEYIIVKIWNKYEYIELDENKIECEIKNGERINVYCMIEYLGDTWIKCEYKNGEKIKVKERYCLGRSDIEFEGEYLNGKRWNGIFRAGRNIYKLKNGRGFTLVFDGSNFYEGEFINGEKNGKGKVFLLRLHTKTF